MLPSGRVTATTRPKGLDHLVIAVRDVDKAAALYHRLGFQVGKRNRHPWGTENRIVQFPGCFLELITVGEGAGVPPHARHNFSFGAFVKDALQRGQGLAMLVLDSMDAKADAASFKADGIGDFEPFFFERQGVRPDGTPKRVAFTLAFAEDRMARHCGFFTCQQHEPQNFWDAEFQKHDNGATGIAAAFMVADNPTDHHIFLEAFTGQRGPRSSSLGLSLPLARGRLDVMTPAAASLMLGGQHKAQAGQSHFAGFAIDVADLDAIKARLSHEAIPHSQMGSRIVVPAEAGMGAAIAFETSS
jgi:catechol 2,3-dioxygenase-like lactoylglutathione lyase family enzyme